MKNLLLLILLLSSSIFSQSKYYTKSGSIKFEASVPLFEEVKANNNTVTSILDVKTGDIAVLALVKGFRFKVALMEEHFNENYAKSRKFPKATFTGEIHNFSIDSLTDIPKLFHSTGELTFHGKKIRIEPQLLIASFENKIQLSSTLILNPEDFNINIPKLIRKKVAETVEVTINFLLIPKNQ